MGEMHGYDSLLLFPWWILDDGVVFTIDYPCSQAQGGFNLVLDLGMYNLYVLCTCAV